MNVRILPFLGAPAFLLMAACSGDPTSSEPTGESGQPVASASDPVFVGAGDIGDCNSGGDEITADLLDDIAGTVFTLGDNAYPKGTATQFANCYDPSWGRHRDRTRPSPGNHDYATPGAAPYYAYFGTRAGPSGKGYYSYDLGTWHIISLNSNIKAGSSSKQAKWLRADLAANSADCARHARASFCAPALRIASDGLDAAPCTSSTSSASRSVSFLTAAASAASLCGVPVPCALMYPMADGSSAASRQAACMAARAPKPCGCGAVMW